MRDTSSVKGNSARVTLLFIAAVPVIMLMAACGAEEIDTTGLPGEMEITSPVFEEGGAIPVRYSCEGEDISPELNWDEVPGGTESFVLIADDPDAPGGIFTHWVVFNIPAGIYRLAEGTPGDPQLACRAFQCRNGFGNTGYGGPCPPRGSLHHYRFTLYALDRTLDLAASASRAQVVNAMEGHILDMARLTGTFQR